MVMMYGPPSFHVNAIWLGLIALILQLLPPVVTSQSSPTFIKKASDPIIGYNEEALNFTWTYSNHSSKRIYFGIWNSNYGLVDPSLLTVNIFPNLSFTLHKNVKEFSAKIYIGRVNWVGDVTQQKASFELSKIEDSDAKYYGIEIDFDDTQHDTIASWSNLIVKPPSVFTFAPNNIYCGKGQMANFTWKYTLNDIDIKDLNSIKFGLYKDGLYKEQCNIQVQNGMVRKSNCSSSRARISSLDAYSKVVFVLRNVNLQDEAIYSIRLGGLKRTMESKTKLFVTDHPKIITNPQSKTVNEGSKLILTCFASGKPEPTITWYKDGRIFKSNSNEIYIVNKTKRTDDGLYGCVARNKVGRASFFSARVEVYYAPIINISRSIVNVHVPVGGKTTLKCPAIANPKARYKWFIDGIVERDQVRENLHVTVTSEEDYKKYICNAINIIGEDNVTFALKQVVSISSPDFITREVGQDVVFMFNITNISAFNWGIRDGNTDYLKQGLIRYVKDNSDGIKLDEKLNSSSYAGRVSFVGDLTKGHAWFKITNLNINDTNQYMAKIYIAAGYQYLLVKLTVVQPTKPTTTYPKTQPSSDSKFIAAGVTVIVVLLAVVVFLLIYICKRKVRNEKAAKRRSSTLNDKDLDAYENTHHVQGASESTALEPLRSVTEKDTETINVNKGEDAIADFRGVSLTPEVTTSLPQHYQKLNRKIPQARPLYEPLNKRKIGKKESSADDPKTYEQLQKNAPRREYQSLESYANIDSKV